MSENAKTGVFWAVSIAVALMAAIVAWPRSTETTSAAAFIGKPLFEDFKDVLEVALLKIDRFDEAMGQLSSFEVLRDSKTQQWTIPSHDDYPADAKDQIRDTATAFLNLEILDVASELKEDHAKFGVVEPNDDSLKVGDEGVGTLVQIKDSKGESLVDLVVGSQVKDATEQRFVRVPTQDVTYVVKFDEKVVTSKFEDWIEDNLLGMSSIDIKAVAIHDYSVVNIGTGAALQKKYNAQLSLEDNGTWQLDKLVTFKEDVEVPESLTQDEELDSAKLNTLKNALGDLKIVDVRRKPEGLSADLLTEASFMEDRKAIQSLQRRGFYAQPTEDGKGEVYSANGELIATLNDGVQYLLRFGTIDQSLGAEEDNEDASVTGLNRYLMVTARVDEHSLVAPEMDAIPKTWDELHPELKAAKSPAVEQPDTDEKEPEGADKKEPEQDADKPVAGPEDADAKPADAKPADKKADEASSTEAGSDGPSNEPAEGAAEDASNTDSADSVDPDVDPATDPVSDEKETAKETTSQAAPSDDDKPSLEAKQLSDEEKTEELEIAQEKVRKANQRKLDEHQEKLDAAKLKVRKLNARFADWYYVVPESEYRKVHLSRSDLVKKKEPATGAGATPGGFAPGAMPPQFGTPLGQ